MKFVYQGFEPLDERFIVQPGPVHKILVVQERPDDKKVATRKSVSTVVPTKTEEFMARTAMRVGQILVVPTTTKVVEDGVGNIEYITTKSTYCSAGDWVVYFEKAAIPVDLLAEKDGDANCPILLKKYDIVMKVKDPNVTEIESELIKLVSESININKEDETNKENK
jgi:hypothetical protein